MDLSNPNALLAYALLVWLCLLFRPSNTLQDSRLGYRPQIHYSPPKGFMNDPNGMFRSSDGTYHLYYQLNPTDIVPGNQHWGHATSMDLLSWTTHNIAISPSAPGEGIFSGSAIIDPNNTSGFFPNQTNGVVAVYTLNTDQEQNQNLAYSYDGGYTFTKFSGNPVISINSTQFRDPKVFWHAPTSKWIMVIAYSQEYAIGVFTSSNLKNWTHASNFTNAGLLGLQYECPNLVELPILRNSTARNMFAPENVAGTMWVLFISINPGAPLGGSISQYFPGTFNGTHFSPVDNAARLSDFSKDNYAGQFFYNIPATSPQTLISWASNWQYTSVVPTSAEGFRSVMTLPRRCALGNATRSSYLLISAPTGLDDIYSPSSPLAQDSFVGNSSLSLNVEHFAPSGTYTFIIRAMNIPEKPTGSLNFSLISSETGESVRGGYLFEGDNTLFLDRSDLNGFQNVFFTGQSSVAHPIDRTSNTFQLQVVVDRSIIEIFLDGGVRSGTALYFSEAILDTLVLSSTFGQSVNVEWEVWGLNAHTKEDESGKDISNSTLVDGDAWTGRAVTA